MRRGPLLEWLERGDEPVVPAQAALIAAQAAWQRDSRCSAFLGEFADYGASEGCACPMTPARARALAGALLDHLLPVLAAHPLGQAPFRCGCDGGTRTLLLARQGRALMLLLVREPGRTRRRAVGFNAGALHEFVLAGEARGRIARRTAGRPDCKALRLGPGTEIALDQASEALLVDRVAARLVSLRIVRLPRHPVPTREYAFETGELLRQSSSDSAESCQELALALLGRMGRVDAVPLMAGIARSAAPDTSDHLRWQALRECIALDTAAGLAVLRTVAGNGADSLHLPATALLAQLCAAHPALEAA